LPGELVKLSSAAPGGAGGRQQPARCLVLDGYPVAFQQLQAAFAQLVDLVIGIKTEDGPEAIVDDFRRLVSRRLAGNS
jgi:hypothetical protein